MNTKKPPLVVIVGPTASGKSALAMALSRQLPAVIINADASQLYRELRIVTARPSEADEAAVPHRLFGDWPGADSASAADWANSARAAIVDAHGTGRVPVIVGGTGLYVRTLLDGIAPVPEIDPAVRAHIRAMEPADALVKLQQLDPARAGQLDRNDRTRIARALEVVMATGRTLSDWQQNRSGGVGDRYHVVGVVLLPPRDWIRARCDARFDAMLAAGAEREVDALLSQRLPLDAPVMKAIGVCEIAAMRTHPEQREVLIASAKAATRQYAKRQYTWFRNQSPSDWQRIEAQLDMQNIDDFVIKLCSTVLTR